MFNAQCYTKENFLAHLLPKTDQINSSSPLSFILTIFRVGHLSPQLLLNSISHIFFIYTSSLHITSNQLILGLYLLIFPSTNISLLTLLPFVSFLLNACRVLSIHFLTFYLLLSKPLELPLLH